MSDTILVCSACREVSCAAGVLMCEDAHRAWFVAVDLNTGRERTRMTVVAFDVHGTPAPQGSKRSVGRGFVEASPKLKPWREAVKWAALAERAEGAPPPFPAGPVVVTIVLFHARPKSHYGTGRNALQLKDNAPDFPWGKPDIDKVTRACLDAISDAGLWGDDSQVSYVTIDKQWAQDYGRPPGARIVITERTTTRGPLTI